MFVKNNRSSLIRPARFVLLLLLGVGFLGQAQESSPPDPANSSSTNTQLRTSIDDMFFMFECQNMMAAIANLPDGEAKDGFSRRFEQIKKDYYNSLYVADAYEQRVKLLALAGDIAKTMGGHYKYEGEIRNNEVVR